ncbi:MAG: arylsulfatase [Kiritimatiellia bacterium]|jgi:arylsulfatase A-like enzyme|nr:arylsulfatase [Kiritimatiellia bacterium]MDP6848357.1 arylsulfatase [Kiritimatiellia bacterium]
MLKNLRSRLSVALWLSLLSALPVVAAQGPNIIYILADDVGYGDLSCYGQKKFSTPNLDRMASEGMLFTEHYSGSAVCAPSRYTLMTGQHIGHARTEGQGQQLRPENRTIAEMLKEAGYATAMVGKWGLGGHTGRPDLKGFDFWYGFLDQRRAHFHYPEWVWRNGEKVMLPDNPKNHKSHTQDLFTEEALGFIRKNKDKPFFLYLPYTLVHAELIVPEEYEKPFRDKLEDKPVEPNPYGILQRGYNRPRYRHAAFAGAMTFLDSDVGKLLALLKELGLDDNTLVMFSSDNGPHSEGGADPKYFDSNGVLQRGKGWLYEGGIRVPMIARWPGRIGEGSRTDHASYFPDVLPTIADICNLKADAQDGISFAPTLLNDGKQLKHEYMYWSYNRHRAVRAGRWKLYRFYDAFNNTRDYREVLFDLKQDPGENNDLALKYPERMKSLVDRIWEFERWKR